MGLTLGPDALLELADGAALAAHELAESGLISRGLTVGADECDLSGCELGAGHGRTVAHLLSARPCATSGSTYAYS